MDHPPRKSQRSSNPFIHPATMISKQVADDPMVDLLEDESFFSLKNTL